METILVIAVVVQSIVAVLRFVAEKPWLTARTREQDCLQLELENVSFVRSTHRDIHTPDEIAALEAEVRLITRKLPSSSSQSETDRILGWNCQDWWRRYLTLPKSFSVMDPILSATFYLFLMFGSIYLLLFLLIPPFSPQPVIQNFAMLYMSILSFGICVLVRDWRLRTATSRVAAT